MLNIRLSLLKTVCTLMLVCMGMIAHADALEIHPDDKPHMNALIERLNLDRSKIKKSIKSREGYKKGTNAYELFGDYKNVYFFDGEHQYLTFITSREDRVISVKIARVDDIDLNEIQHFKDLYWLNFHVTGIKSLKGISKLKKLMRLDFLGNNEITSFDGLEGLKDLEYIKSGTVKTLVDISGMKGLPQLKEFYCNSCIIENIEPLSKFKNLKRLELGTTVKSLEPLSTLKDLEYLELNSDNVTDIDVLNDLTSLEELWVWNNRIEHIKFTKKLENFKKFNLVRPPLKSTPDFSKLPNLEELSIIGAEIVDFDYEFSLDSIRILKLIQNKNMKSLPRLENMPNLEKAVLSETPIKKLDFGYLPKLEVLDLTGTEITQLGDFSKLPSLRELKLFDTKVESLEPLLDAPKLWSVTVNHTARDIPNAYFVLKALRVNSLSRYKDEERPTARQRYEELLKQYEEQKAESKSNSRIGRSRN